MTDVLVLSLAALPRQLGATLHHDIEWTAPDDLGTPSMRVETGTVIPLDVDLTSVDGGVLVRASTSVELVGECVRCLDEVRARHDVDAADVYFETAPPTDEDDPEADDARLIGPRDTIDLEPLLRDSIVTLVNERPLCRADCPGLCDVCGEKWDELPADHEHVLIDPRLASLASLLDQQISDPTD